MKNKTYHFACSEQGYNHIKAGKVCQDSSGSYSDELMSIAVVADGHGSDNYPRTDRGSGFAVNVTINTIQEFVRTVKENDIDISQDSNNYLEQLTKHILQKWYEAVEADYSRYPLTEEELTKVSSKYKLRYKSGEYKEKAYGATLIAVCQTKEYWFGLQIGDGKCVCVSQEGEISEPISWDEACQQNITTSICDSDAIGEFRYYFSKECPIAILIGSDGIDDSYAGSEELYRFYQAVLGVFVEHGPEIGANEVREHLPIISKRGSGDDVSIAGIISATLSVEFKSVLKAQREYSAAKAQIEQTEHDIIQKKDKLEYVCSALKTAKLSYERLCEQRKKAEAEQKEAQKANAEAKKRFEDAETALKNAVEAHKNSEHKPSSDMLSDQDVIVDKTIVTEVPVEQEDNVQMDGADSVSTVDETPIEAKTEPLEVISESIEAEKVVKDTEAVVEVDEETSIAHADNPINPDDMTEVSAEQIVGDESDKQEGKLRVYEVEIPMTDTLSMSDNAVGEKDNNDKKTQKEKRFFGGLRKKLGDTKKAFHDIWGK